MSFREEVRDSWFSVWASVPLLTNARVINTLGTAKSGQFTSSLPSSLISCNSSLKETISHLLFGYPVAQSYKKKDKCWEGLKKFFLFNHFENNDLVS